MRRRVQTSSFLGALIEWYDFYLYSFAAATVLNTLFFPKLDPGVGVIASFATLAVGFIARPLGALIFARFGDRHGRKQVLVVTLLLMGLSSALMGLLPTYGDIGIWAPILLVALRVLQGLSAGGEFGGAILMNVEHAQARRRGVASAVAQVGLYAGILLANGVFFLVSLLPVDQFQSWGWRLPFLGSFVLVVVALWIRLGISESPVFEEAKAEHALSDRPVLDLFRYQWRPLLIVVMLLFGIATFSAFMGAFMTSYATQLKFSTSSALAMSLTGTALGVVVLPVSAALSDRFGRKRMAYIGVGLMLVTPCLVFPVIEQKVLVLSILAVALLWISHSTAYGPIAAWMSELFPTSNRYGGVSIGYQVSALLGAGFFPLIGAALLAASGGVGHYALVLGYVLITVLITLVGALLARETAHDDFVELDQHAVAESTPEVSAG
jgi:MFS family permease